MTTYVDLSDEELEVLAAARARRLLADFTILQTAAGWWIAAFEIEGELGRVNLLSSESRERRESIRTLLMSDDLDQQRKR